MIFEFLKLMVRMMVDVCVYVGSVYEFVYLNMCVCNFKEGVLLKSVKILMKFEIIYFYKFCRDW